MRVTLPFKDFARGLAAVSRAMGSSENYQDNLAVEVSPEGNLTLVATNGHWMAAWKTPNVTIPADGTEVGGTLVAVPGVELRPIIKMLYGMLDRREYVPSDMELTLGPRAGFWEDGPKPFSMRFGDTHIRIPGIPLDNAPYAEHYGKIFDREQPEKSVFFAGQARYMRAVADAFIVASGDPQLALLYQVGDVSDPVIVTASGQPCLTVALMPVNTLDRHPAKRLKNG